MKIQKTIKETSIHHTLILDEIPYFRNEVFIYHGPNLLVKHNVEWHVGNKEGKGPYSVPGASPSIDRNKYTPKKLESMFKKLQNEK
jgi:hypothetical protein